MKRLNESQYQKKVQINLKNEKTERNARTINYDMNSPSVSPPPPKK